MSTIYENINNLYTKKSFIESYGVEICITTFIIIAFILAILYFYVMNNIKPIVADWNNQKCNPAVIPFAGLINNGKDTTPFEFTGQNFTGCVQSILTNITSQAFQPFYYIIKTIIDAFKELADAVNSIRAVLDRFRDSIKDFSQETMSRTLNITMPLVQMIIGIKDMGAKMIGVLSASLFTLMGSYLTMKSLFLFMVDLIIKILIIIAGIIAGLLVISFIPIFGTWAIPVAAANIAIMILILIPTIMIKIFMDDVMSLSTADTPAVPSCFAGDTIIKVNDSKDNNDCTITINKKISTIEVDDVLSDGSVVTGIMKLSSAGQTMYNLDGILVSGEHKVYDSEFIHVKHHPQSKLLKKPFTEPYLYCLLTSSKRITINDTLFCDWDDIDDNVISKLDKNCVIRGYIPPSFKSEDIHAYLDNGLHKNTKVKLRNGNELTIDMIKVNDILSGGEQVLATVKIDVSKLKGGIQDYRLDNNVHISCSNNITINNYLGGINTFNLYGTPILDEPTSLYAYQLLTSTGYFNVNGLIISDYNNGIDRFILL